VQRVILERRIEIERRRERHTWSDARGDAGSEIETHGEMHGKERRG